MFERLNYCLHPTPLGDLFLGADDEGLRIATFVEGPSGRPFGWPSRWTPAAMPGVCDELDRYFAGTLQVFTTPLAPEGTEFQRRVWAGLQGIPFGATRSYSEIAAVLGNPGLVRAVGTANGANPIAILIPCHRVIGADGRLVGYAGGLDRKKALLRLEGGRGALF